MKQVLWLILVCCLAGSVHAQVSAGGTPVSFTKTFLGDAVPVVVMPAVDVATLMAEDEIHNVKGNSFRFGKDLDVNLNLSNSGKWQPLKNGDRVWRLGIKSTGAYSINLIFSDFFMPEGAKMFVYNADKSMVIGAFTAFNNKDHGKFSTDVVQGSHIIIEYFEPASVSGQGRIAISKVIHAYYDIFFGPKDGDGRSFGQSGSCNNNVACPISAGWENQVNATLMYLLANGTEVCSGSMLNNAKQDGKPYFLSANHCYSGDYATWVFRFNYQSPNCTPSQNGPTTQSVSGASLKARRTDSDFALYELSVTPPLSYNAYYAGWSNDNVAPTSAVGIHHPAGDVKKFSVDNDALTTASYSGGTNTHWRINDWDAGTTEGGSSGSPLFDQNKRVVGQLHGGGAACGNNQSDYYGKFALSWNGTSSSSRLKDWLDPDNTGVTTLDGTTFNVPTSQRDVQMLDISGVENYSCDNTVAATVRFQNRGSDTLTSFTFRYRTNPGTWDTATWSGSAAFGISATNVLPIITVNPGIYTLEIEVVSVNGQADQNAANDTVTKAFTVITGQNITVTLRTDNYGSETTLRILNSSNVVVWEQSGFGDNTSYTLTPCLADGCYIFRIVDSEGDGICCTYGNGSYRVNAPDGSLVVQGGQFGSTQSTNFCISSLPPVAAITADATQVCAGEGVNFNNQSTGSFTSVTWSFPGGSPTTSTAAAPSITYSAAGSYDVTLIVTGALGSDTIIMPNYIEVREKPIAAIVTTNTSVAGTADGSATVTPTGFGPFTYQWSNGGTTPTINGLPAGNYTVTVSDNIGCDTTLAFSILDGPVGINNLAYTLGLTLYPNPANEVVNVSLWKSTEGTLQVFDNLGKLVFETNQLQQQNAISVDTWPAGVYHLKIVVAQGTVMKKFVVN